VEADSLAIFSLWLLTKPPPTHRDLYGYTRTRNDLVRSIQDVLRRGDPLDGCLRQVAELAARQIDTRYMGRYDREAAVRHEEGAKAYLWLHGLFGRAPPSAPDLEDEEAIAAAFRP
jgi:hypothetical protein